MGAESYVGLYS